MKPRRHRNDMKKFDQLPFSIIAPRFMRKPSVPISVSSPRFMREPSLPISVESPGRFGRRPKHHAAFVGPELSSGRSPAPASLSSAKTGVMNQCRLTKALVNWIDEHPWKPNLSVRYDGKRKNLDTPKAEHCSLYIGEKKRGRGRSTQVGQVDILTEETSMWTVDLLIEVEPLNSPKKILGELLPPLLADNFTPSHFYGIENKHQIRNAVFLFVTVVPDNKASQKCPQLALLERTIIQRLNFTQLDVRTIRFCIGTSEADAFEKCTNAIRELLWKQDSPGVSGC